jgi:hypothetical protein
VLCAFENHGHPLCVRCERVPDARRELKVNEPPPHGGSGVGTLGP